MIALIQVGKFNDALQLIERNKLTQLLFERAYCEYRLNQPDKALRTIDKAERPLAASLKELRAQVLYRLEQFDECFDAYKDIIKNTNDDYEDERATNLSAAAANLAVVGSVNTNYLNFEWVIFADAFCPNNYFVVLADAYLA